MARSAQYTPLRRHVMQLVVWLMLGATIGLAALVGHMRRNWGASALSNRPLVIQDLSVRLPAGWRMHSDVHHDARVVAAVAEPGSEETARIVSVYLETGGEDLSPLEYLVRDFDLQPPAPDGPESDSLVPGIETIAFGPWPGVMVSATVPIPGHGEQTTGKVLLACAVLPSGRAVIVRLEGLGEPEPGDRELMQQIAQSVRMSGEPALSRPGQEMEVGGVKLRAPANFSLVTPIDLDRTDRVLWYVPPPAASASAGSNDADWGAIEIVPCLLPPRLDSAAAAIKLESEFATMLLVRDRRWRRAKMSLIGNGRLRADPPNPAEIFSARAYLVAEKSGQCVMVVLRGTPQTFDDTWKKLEPTIKFAASSEASELAAAGAAETARLREERLKALLADQRHDNWWIWSNPSANRQLGWTHLAWKSDEFAAESETRLKPSEQRMILVTDDWSASVDLSQYRCESSRSDSVEASAGSLHQAVELRRGTLLMGAIGDSRSAARWKTAAPPQFVPGALVPLMIGKLSATPLLLSSDSFLGYEGIMPPGPLTLIVRPAGENSSSSEGEAIKLRVVSVEVSGSGQISRWYLQQDGQLDHIEFAGGVRRTKSTQTAVKFEFAHDATMKP
jgi:hypothetical protein